MIFVDTNVVIDVLDKDPSWFAWSLAQLGEAVAVGNAVVSVVVIAELSRGFAAFDHLERVLEDIELEIAPLGSEAAFVAGRRFQQYREGRTGGDALRVLPDFLIGAQALTDNGALLTRDPRLYRRYFPELDLITPDDIS